MPLAFRRILRYEVIEDDACWSVVSVDHDGNHYLVCDCDTPRRARRRASHLNRKLRRATRPPILLAHQAGQARRLN